MNNVHFRDMYQYRVKLEYVGDNWETGNTVFLSWKSIWGVYRGWGNKFALMPAIFTDNKKYFENLNELGKPQKSVFF